MSSWRNSVFLAEKVSSKTEIYLCLPKSPIEVKIPLSWDQVAIELQSSRINHASVKVSAASNIRHQLQG